MAAAAEQPSQSAGEALEQEALADSPQVEEPTEIAIVDPVEIAAGDEPGELDPRSGVPKVLKAYSVTGANGGPRLAVVPHFLGEAEIEHLLALAEGCWEPSEVGTGVYRSADESKDLFNTLSFRRTSYSCMLEPFQTSIVTSIEHRLARLAGIDLDYLEPLNMVRYAPGQLFKTHHDGRFRPKTVFIYLNDLPEGDGGETLFPELGLQIVPRRGCAVMWANVLGPQQDDRRMVHQGLPPRSAVKYGVNCFFNDKKMKAYRLAGTDTDLRVDSGLPVPGAGIATRWRTLDATELRAGVPDALASDQLRRLQVAEAPPVWLAPALLSRGEAAVLAALADTGMQLEDLQQRELVAALQRRMSALVGRPLECLERVEVSRRGPRAQTCEHQLQEEAYRAKFGSWTAFVFLNDLDEDGGGELRFPQLGLQVLARAGCAAGWRGPRAGVGGPCAMHLAMPPKFGERYGVFCMFREAATTS
uniref:Prolyl 4-hydroxylase alpha subunit domain-containing protein n=1 Tax=Pyrodinium bahamense TaxID=73915 RepID=A0A7S0ADX9_9DINO